jgi:hypothetical protein
MLNFFDGLRIFLLLLYCYEEFRRLMNDLSGLVKVQKRFIIKKNQNLHKYTTIPLQPIRKRSTLSTKPNIYFFFDKFSLLKA